MSRTVIAIVVAVVIVALTGIAFFVTTTTINDKVSRDADAQLKRAYQVVSKLAQLEAIDTSNKAERLAGDRSFVDALKTDSGIERANQARLGFTKFTSSLKDEPAPDLIALVDAHGNLVAMSDVPTVIAKQWKKEGGKPDETIIPALDVVLASKNRTIISDIWWNQDQMMKIGVAPVIDPEAPPPLDNPDGVAIEGAIVVAYAQTANEAQHDKTLLGTELAYYDAQKVAATSFTRGSNQEDTSKAKQLADILRSGKVSVSSGQQKVTIDGVDYYAAAVPMPRQSTRQLPADYPPVSAGAMVLAPITDPQNAGAAIKLFILLLGLGALAISMLGLYLSHRRLVAQVDAVEQGVTDIINGNVDRTFRPVGLELDGLANGLNVMLARLLGRPEPGEEEFDEEGNPIIPGRVEFEETEEGAKPQTDPDLARLAQESEPDYYKRVFTEYVAARKAVGSPDDVSFENFIAKLKVNEGKLKAQYQCRAVRFRVVTKDNKVSLKPVPIFA
ncbi:MAG TPA: MXAN_5187 C-terminal domain-containing protein [Kofleriaceae bacterium]|nr:MXAN_5187 C-terminal domain-containing protein [Kofleriaceae bacterium]